MNKDKLPAAPKKRLPDKARHAKGLERIDGHEVLENEHTHPIRALKLGTKELLVLGFSTWKDQAALDIRVHFLTPAPDSWWQPTKQGIRISIEEASKVLEFIAQQRDIVKTLLGEKK